MKKDGEYTFRGRLSLDIQKFEWSSLAKWFRKRAPGHRRDISQIDTVAVNTAQYHYIVHANIEYR